jgi:hypothetical protein
MTSLRVLSTYVLPRRRRLRNGIALGAQGRDRMLEPLCVVAIIMVLLAFALDSYLPALERIRSTEATNLTLPYRERVVEAMAVQGVMPQTIEMRESARRPGGKAFVESTWQDGEIIFTLAAAAAAGLMPDAELAGAQPLTLSFRFARTATGNRLVQLCGIAKVPPGFTAAPARHTTVPAAFLPAHCRI